MRLGYRIFPFHAFDADGNLILPELDLPSEFKEKLDTVTREPQWMGIYQHLSYLDEADLSWPGRCYTLGVAFDRFGISLMPVKSLDSLPKHDDTDGPRMARRWVESLDSVTMTEVQRFAGEAPAIDPQWGKALRDILAAIKEAIGGGSGTAPPNPPAPPEPPGNNSGDQPGTEPDRGDKSTSEDEVDVAALSPVMGIELLIKLVDVSLSLTRPQPVTSINFWYVPASWKDGFRQRFPRWKTLAQPFDHLGKRRSVNAIWDPVNKTIWHWGDENSWTYGSPKVRKNCMELWDAFYPYDPHPPHIHLAGDEQ